LKNYFIIVNPVSGGKKTKEKLNKVTKALRKSGADFEVFETRPDLHPEVIIQKFLNPTAYSDIMVIGGDGTIHQTANGLPSSAIPLSLISAGTGNDTVRTLLGTLNLNKQIVIAISGNLKNVDTGVCNDMIFTNGFGIGFDGKVVEKMISNGKKFKGHLSYFHTVFSLLAGYRESELIIYLDGNKITRKVFLMTVAKGKSFGGGFLLNPDAKINDGYLDVCVINKVPVYKRFFFLPLMKFGIHKYLKEVEFFKCKECTIEMNEKMVAHLDGEFIGHPPFNIRIRPDSLLIRGN
jgi:diacylglycerol kinase (ATP)